MQSSIFTDAAHQLSMYFVQHIQCWQDFQHSSMSSARVEKLGIKLHTVLPVSWLEKSGKNISTLNPPSTVYTQFKGPSLITTIMILSKS